MLQGLGCGLHVRHRRSCSVSVPAWLHRLTIFVIEIENDGSLLFFRARRCGSSIFVAATTTSATAAAATAARTVTGFVTRGSCGRSRRRNRHCCDRSRRRYRIGLRLFDSRRGLWPTLALWFAALRLILRRCWLGFLRLTLIAPLLIRFAALRTTGLRTAAALAGFAALLRARNAAFTACRGRSGCLHRSSGRCGRGFCRSLEESEQACKEALRLHGLGLDHRRFAFRANRRLACRHDGRDRGFFRFAAGLGYLRRRCGDDCSDAFVARLGFLGNLGASQALDFEVRRFELVVGDDDHRHIVAHLDFDDALALFVEQEVGDIRRCLHEHLSRVFLHRLFFDQAQH